MRTGGRIGEYVFAPSPLQGGQLQAGILVVCGDTTIADFHPSILTAISDARNVLFLLEGKSATKFLPSGTPAYGRLYA
jgi:hypothetical protein